LSLIIAGIKDKRATTYQHCSMTIKKSLDRNIKSIDDESLESNKKRMRESHQHMSYVNNIITSLLSLSNWNWNEKGTTGIDFLLYLLDIFININSLILFKLLFIRNCN
jgi:protein associated with RNAse G/E